MPRASSPFSHDLWPWREPDTEGAPGVLCNLRGASGRCGSCYQQMVRAGFGWGGGRVYFLRLFLSMCPLVSHLCGFSPCLGAFRVPGPSASLPSFFTPRSCACCSFHSPLTNMQLPPRVSVCSRVSEDTDQDTRPFAHLTWPPAHCPRVTSEDLTPAHRHFS
jgi:hypothetical protein